MARPGSLLVSLALLQGCGGDDTPSNALPDARAGDATLVDATGDAPPSARTKLVVVHASPNLPAVRVCFGQGTTLVDTPPFPDVGLAPGAAFVVPNVADQLSGAVTVYLVAAAKAPARCSGLAQLVVGSDYQKTPPLDANAIGGARTLLLAVTGCLGINFDPSANTQRCGADFQALAGNLKVRVLELDRDAKANLLGAQLAHLAPSLGAVTAGLANAPDAGFVLYAPIAPSVRYGEVRPTPAAGVVVPDANRTVIRVGVLDPDGGPNTALYSFPFVGDAGNGENATFALVGDPSADAGYPLRVVPIANDPNVPQYP